VKGAAPPLAKLTRPRLEGAVERARLFVRLDECLRAPVVWIVGPPGAGKTTLASTYLASRKAKHLWIQTDSADSDPASFFYYLRAACESAGLAKKALPPLLTREYLADVPGFARRTFRGLFAHFRSGLTLALDNYQEVPAESALHRALAEACEEIPEGSHLLAMSRVDPPPEYARLVASERLARLEWEALKLTREEAGEFARARAALTEEAIESLYRSCGGWAAGFTLLRERLGRTGLVNHIDASEGLQTVFDYFAAEALRDTSPENREILVHTALMPRFTAAMAIAASGKTSAPQLLQWLHQRHLFTDRRASGKEVFYQYHALFQSFLASEARERLDADAFAALARRSAQVLADNGLQEDAIELLIEAGEYENACELLLFCAPRIVGTGRGETFLHWLGIMPAGATEAHPWFDYWKGQVLMGHSLPDARVEFEQAYEGFARRQDRTGRALAVVGVLETYFYQLDDFTPATPWIEKLPDLFEPAPAFSSTDVAVLVYQALVAILFWARPEAELLSICVRRLESVLAEDIPCNARVLAAAQLTDFYCRDQPNRAAAALSMGLKALEHEEVSPPVRVVWYARTGWYHLALGEFDVLTRNLARARAIINEHGLQQYLAWILAFEADVAFCAGDEEALRRAIASHRALPETSSKQAFARLLCSRAKLHTLLGNCEAARLEVEESYRLAAQGGFKLPQLGYGTFLAMLLLELGRANEALELAFELEDVYPPDRFPVLGRRAETIALVVEHARGGSASSQERLRHYLTEAQARGARCVVTGNHPFLSQRLCEMALEAGVATEFVRSAMRAERLRARAAELEYWLWPVRIRTLGGFSIDLYDEPLEFKGKVPRRPLELLQALVAFGSVNVAQEKLCAALWPEGDGDDAAIAMRVTLARLRKLLQDAHAVRLQDGKLSLDRTRCYVDVSDFELLVRRIEAGNSDPVSSGSDSRNAGRQAGRLTALYRGHFLHNEREQPWMLPLREQLKSRFVRAAAQLGERLEGEGHVAEALALYERALAQEPTAERIYRRVMLIQVGEGRQSEAMTTYRRCRDMLSIVLGTKPDAETESLHRKAQAG
jgi:ATP/maltotriose-dependent transcriptional regulator MalT/DNA-binding SARP family transcriptional activator